MTQRKLRSVVRISAWPIMTLAAVLMAPTAGAAQPTPADHKAHHPATAPSELPLADQVKDLRAKVAQLEAALGQSHQPSASNKSAAAGTMNGKGGMSSGATTGMGTGRSMGMKGGGKQPMGQMGGMSGGQGGGMGMMDMDGMMMGQMGMGGSGSMPGMGGGQSGMGGGGMAGMGGMEQGMMQMMGMMGMSPGAGMGGMAMPSALPGFPGASHLYHIGSTGFFLDHGEHITLTTQQQTALNAAREKALLDKANTQRKIDAAEQELWALTASDQPDGAKIEAKVQEIEKLRGEQRLNFIRAVGEAAKALTDEQRKSLLGQLPPQNQSSQPGPGGGMGDM